MADTIELMKERVLNMAVRGELVDQLEEEGTAEELLYEIQKENLKRKNKTEKNLEPFEIPKNWHWVRLEDISTIIMGQSPPGDSVSSDIEGIEFHQGKIKFGELYLLESDKKTNNPKKVVAENTLLLSVRAPVGNLNITTRKISIGRGLCGIVGAGHISTKFLFYFLSTAKGLMESKSTGTTFKAISGVVIKELPFPLPPIAEQKRIVVKIEEIFSVIDQIGTRKGEALTIINNMRQTALQDAIMGTLVEQDETDETASELYEKIQNEKEQLVKEKKIKKEKSLREIEDNEIPFEIPASWKWVRLGNITEYIQRGKSPKYSLINEYPVISQKCIQWTGVSLEEAKFIEPSSIEKYTEERFLREGDILWNSTGRGSLGRVGLFTDSVREGFNKIVADSHVTVVRGMRNHVNYGYLFSWLKSPEVQNVIESKSTGTTNQIELGTGVIKEQLISLPPLAEQERISEKINGIMAICDQMEAIFDGSLEVNEDLKVV